MLAILGMIVYNCCPIFPILMKPASLLEESQVSVASRRDGAALPKTQFKFSLKFPKPGKSKLISSLSLLFLNFSVGSKQVLFDLKSVVIIFSVNDFVAKNVFSGLFDLAVFSIVSFFL